MAGRTRWLAQGVTLALGVLLVVSTAPARAYLGPGDFPTTGDVRSSIGRGGTWDRYLAKRNAGKVVGSRPRGCASDRPFRAARESRAAYYSQASGYVPGSRRPVFSASVTLYRFGSSGAAKRALKRVKAHVKGCPKYTEWVCTQCDGIFDVWQQLASVPTIGDGTVAWAGRQMDNFGSRFRKAVVRDGRIVIEARVSVGSADPTVGPRFPSTRPTKGQLRKVATTAYWAAPWG